MNDVAALSAIARALGHPGLDPGIAQAIDQLADSGSPGRSVLVEETARLAGLLDLVSTEDAEQLASRLAQRRPGHNVVLTATEHASYEQLADRINAMATGDALSRRHF